MPTGRKRALAVTHIITGAAQEAPRVVLARRRLARAALSHVRPILDHDPGRDPSPAFPFRRTAAEPAAAVQRRAHAASVDRARDARRPVDLSRLPEFR